MLPISPRLWSPPPPPPNPRRASRSCNRARHAERSLVSMSVSSRRKTLLIISQTFVPDPASVGQHMADVAAEMVRRGHRVLVYTSARGYENPNVKYPPRETFHGVQIRRLALSSFGKKS